MKKVLVVDDEEKILTVLSAFISHLGHQVDCASNGDIAGEFLAATNYDLLVTDIQMPKCNGITLLSRLKELNGYQFPCKVIVMSGAASTEQLEQLKVLVVDEFMPKPIQFNKLKIIMDELLVDNKEEKDSRT